jgi:hypothetical protein
MITIQLLEDNDIIQATDWCRPMVIQTISNWSDTISFTNTYSGDPENNVKWLTAEQCCPAWVGKRLKDFNDGMERLGVWHEFIRGNLPVKHQYGKTKREHRKAYEDYLRSNAMPYGKYKDYTFYEIMCKDVDYFNWAKCKNLIKDDDTY